MRITTLPRIFVLSGAILLPLTACTTVVQSPGEAAAVAPQLTVERFLQAANARDVEAMSRLFGTADGPIGDTGSTFGCFFKKIGSWLGGTSCQKRLEIEVRLDAIARVLQHRNYRLGREEPVAGRPHPTRRLFVDLDVSSGTVTGVPFEVVRTEDGRWLVELVDLERIMTQSR